MCSSSGHNTPFDLFWLSYFVLVFPDHKFIHFWAVCAVGKQQAYFNRRNIKGKIVVIRLSYYYVTANFGYFMLIFALRLKLRHPWGRGSFDTNHFIHISFSLFKWRLNFENWLPRLPGRALKVLPVFLELHHPWGGGILGSGETLELIKVFSTSWCRTGLKHAGLSY